MAKECTCQGPRPHSPCLSHPVTCCQPRLDGDCGSQSLGLWGRGSGGDLYLPGEGRGFRGSEEAPRTRPQAPAPVVAATPTSIKLAAGHGLWQTWVKEVRAGLGPCGHPPPGAPEASGKGSIHPLATWEHPSPGHHLRAGSKKASRHKSGDSAPEPPTSWNSRTQAWPSSNPPGLIYSGDAARAGLESRALDLKGL